MQDALPPCPRCGATHVVRNGLTRAGSVNLLCRGCGRRFVPHPKRPPITPATEALVRRLLLERLSLRAIARSVGVSRAWLQRFANTLYREDTPHAPGRLKKSGAS